jgi:hypothetical protein
MIKSCVLICERKGYNLGWIIFFVLLFMVGCDGIEFDCAFEFKGFLNGPDAENATSKWECVDPDDQLFSFQTFRDGTGFDSRIGPFTFERTGCTSLSLRSEEATAALIDIRGSIDSGMLTFMQVSGKLGNFDVFCELALLDQ